MLSILCAALLAFTAGDGSSVGDQPAAKIEIVCKPQALIRGTRILIADLADILPPGTTAHRLGQISFGARPASGFSRVVSKHEILQCMVMAGEDAARLAGSDIERLSPTRSGILFAPGRQIRDHR